MIHPLAFLKSVFSEEGEGSFSRVAQGAVVFSTLFWISYLVVKNHVMPDLNGPSLFIGTGAVGHYGINKASEIISAFNTNPPPNPPQQGPPGN